MKKDIVFINRLVIISTIIVLFWGSTLFADSPGTSGARILTQSFSARGLGMGNAFTSVIADPGCAEFNPAGLAWLNNTIISASYVRGLIDTEYGSLSYFVPVLREGVGGLSLLTLQSGDIELITPYYTDNKIVKAQEDYILSLSLSTKFNDYSSAGVNVKMLYSKLLEEYTAQVVVYDIGLLYRFYSGVSLGIVLRNLGSEITYMTQKDSLPTTLKLGLSYDLNIIQFIVDLVKSNDKTWQGSTGLEYWIMKMFAFRIGYKIGYDIDTFTVGFGVKVRGIELDYGIGNMTELGLLHRVTLTMKL